MRLTEEQNLKVQKSLDLLLLCDWDMLRKAVEPIFYFHLSQKTVEILVPNRMGRTQKPGERISDPYRLVGDIARETDAQLLANLNLGEGVLAEIHRCILDPLGLSNPVTITGWPDRTDDLHDLIITKLTSILDKRRTKPENTRSVVKPLPKQENFDLATARGRLMALNLPKSLRPRIR